MQLPPYFLSSFSKKLDNKFICEKKLYSSADCLILQLQDKVTHQKLLVKIEDNTGIHRQSSTKNAQNYIPYISDHPISGFKNINYMFTFYACTKEKPSQSCVTDSRSNIQKKTLKMPYLLLLCCACIFLFLLYQRLMLLSQTSDKKAMPNLVASNTAISYSLQPDNSIKFQSDSPIPSALPSIISPSVSPIKETISPKNQQLLNLSNQRLTSDLLEKYNGSASTTTTMLANNCHISSCENFSIFTSLTELYLHHNKIQTLEGLTNLNALQLLVISKNPLSDLSALSSLKELTCLDLSCNTSLPSLKPIASLKKLKYLIITNSSYNQKEIIYLQRKLPTCTILY